MTKYAAHDDLSIYAIGNTEQEALQEALLASEGKYEVSPITDEFAQKIVKEGFNGSFDTFGVDDKGVIYDDSEE